eukprot:364798-Chlamydomonas_euryale.AAC.12
MTLRRFSPLPYPQEFPFALPPGVFPFALPSGVFPLALTGAEWPFEVFPLYASRRCMSHQESPSFSPGSAAWALRGFLLRPAGAVWPLLAWGMWCAKVASSWRV